MFDTAEVDTELLAVSDAMISEFLESAECFVGVRFNGYGKIYTYISPPCSVGSLVRVPGSWYHPEPQVVTVVTLAPKPPPGVALKRVLEVLS